MARNLPKELLIATDEALQKHCGHRNLENDHDRLHVAWWIVNEIMMGEFYQQVTERQHKTKDNDG